MEVHCWTYDHCLFVVYLAMSQSDTDGYRIPNFRNFWIRIGYGCAKIFSDMDQELKNLYPLTSATYLCSCSVMYLYVSLLETPDVQYYTCSTKHCNEK